MRWLCHMHERVEREGEGSICVSSKAMVSFISAQLYLYANRECPTQVLAVLL